MVCAENQQLGHNILILHKFTLCLAILTRQGSDMIISTEAEITKTINS
jgi:hypothetical protein